MQSDAALLERYSHTRDEAAFAELVRRHVDAVYSAALRRLGSDVHLAQDVTQKVFIEFSRQANLLSRHPTITGWLYTTTRNIAAKTIRSEQRRKSRERDACDMNDLPSGGADWVKVSTVLDAAIDELSEADRAAVLLRFIERKSFQQIGAALRVSEDAARMRVDRALEKLRRGLARRGMASSAALLGAALTEHAVTAAPIGLAASATAAGVATTPVAVSALAVTLQFMSTSKLATGLAAGLLIAAGLGTATYEAHARQVAEASLADATRQYDETVAALKSTNQRIEEVNTSIGELQKKLAAAHAAKSAAEEEQKRLAAAKDPDALGQAFMKRHPEVKQALIDWLTENEDFTYGELFRTLHLTPEQIARVRSLIREGEAFGRTLDPNGLEWARFDLKSGRPWPEAHQQLRSIIGKEGESLFFKLMNDHSNLYGATEAVAELMFSDTPMTQQQALDYAKLLNDPSLHNKDAGAFTYRWERLREKAGQILSPRQMVVIDHLEARVTAQNAQADAVQRAKSTK